MQCLKNWFCLVLGKGEKLELRIEEMSVPKWFKKQGGWGWGESKISRSQPLQQTFKLICPLSSRHEKSPSPSLPLSPKCWKKSSPLAMGTLWKKMNASMQCASMETRKWRQVPVHSSESAPHCGENLKVRKIGSLLLLVLGLKEREFFSF